MADFQREFGGLNDDSEASYGIQQFFLNGGAEAWVIRTAGGTPQASSVILRDTAGNEVLRARAGRRIRRVSVDDPGTWGDLLRLDVDYDTSNPADTALFNLTVSEVELRDGQEVVVDTETYRNLTMATGVTNNAIAVVNDASKRIQLSRETSWTSTDRPAATGTTSGDASGATLTSGDTFDIDYGGSSAAGAQLQFTTAPTTVLGMAQVLQASIRAAGAALSPPEPMLTGATVQVIGNTLRALAGRTASGYNAATVLSFTDTSGTPTGDLAFPAGFENVQQYALGSVSTAGAQLAEDAGDDGTLPTASELVGVRDPDKSGMYALEDVDLFNILCFPGMAGLSAGDVTALVSEAEAYCLEQRSFLLVDLPENVNSLEEARTWLDDNGSLRHRNAAAYFPRVRIPDPLNEFRLRPISPSGTIAGLYARTDGARGVWKAPAGIESTLRNVSELDYPLSDQENGQLNPLGLNCLRGFDVFGKVCWGARTLVGADQLASEWKYVPVRRLALFIEESLFRGTQWVVFEPNDEPLWAQIRLNVGAFMQNLFLQGAFQGSTPREAYLVKCDSETTTQNDIDRGVVNILVGFAPLKPAEFVIIRIQQLAGQTQA
jgi:hypothetical protein